MKSKRQGALPSFSRTTFFFLIASPDPRSRARSLKANQSEPPGTIPAAEADAGVKPSAQSPLYNVPTGNRGRSDCEHNPIDQSSGFDATFRLSTARRLSEFVAHGITSD